MCVSFGAASWAKVQQAQVAKQVVETYVAQHEGAKVSKWKTLSWIYVADVIVNKALRYRGTSYASPQEAFRELAAQIIERNPNVLATRVEQATRDLVAV